MALDPLSVQIILDEIHCYDEGDGWGSAEPYLWTVFFKVDGSSVSLTEELTLSGTATVKTTPGSHGNLGDTDVDAGDTVPIPSAIGKWLTTMTAIPVPASVEPVLPNGLAGLIGVVCVLMEEDNVTHDGAEAGHRALNSTVEQALNSIVASRSFSNQEVTDEEIEQFQREAGRAVRDAIRKQQNAFEDLWSWLNRDDPIGNTVFLFNHDKLDANSSQNFSERWREDGDWEIRGRITTFPVSETTTVPSVIGRTPGVAAERIRAANLEPRFTGDDGPGARVSRQLPDSGAVVLRGSTVRLRLAGAERPLPPGAHRP